MTVIEVMAAIDSMDFATLLGPREEEWWDLCRSAIDNAFNTHVLIQCVFANDEELWSSWVCYKFGPGSLTLECIMLPSEDSMDKNAVPEEHANAPVFTCDFTHLSADQSSY